MVLINMVVSLSTTQKIRDLYLQKIESFQIIRHGFRDEPKNLLLFDWTTVECSYRQIGPSFVPDWRGPRPRTRIIDLLFNWLDFYLSPLSLLEMIHIVPTGTSLPISQTAISPTRIFHEPCIPSSYPLLQHKHNSLENTIWNLIPPRRRPSHIL